MMFHKKHAIKIAGLCLLTILSLSCGGATTDKPIPGAWRAISVSVQATTDLNLFQDSAHALNLYVIQLSDVKDFTKASGNVATLLAYIEKGSQNTGVTRFQQLVVQPGQLDTNVVNRIAGSTWVAVVAGFYFLNPEKSVRVFQLPEDPSKKLELSFTLGPDSILKMQ